MKTKKGLSKYRILIDSLSKTLFFKIMVVLSFFLILYGYSLGSKSFDFMFSLIVPYSFDFFNMMFCFLLLLNTLNIFYVVNKNYNYLIRMENRENSAKSLISINLIFNVIWGLTIFLLILICNIVFRSDTFRIVSFLEYNVSSLIYGCFYFIRYYFFIMLISTIFILLLSKFKKIYVYILMLIFIFGFLFVKDSFGLTYNSLRILPWEYFTYTTYSTFMLDVCYSLLYCIILELIVMFLYNINISSNKIKFRETYFLLNDLEYFIKKNKIVILICCLLPILFSFTCRYDYPDGNYVFITSLGLDLNKDNFDILSFLIYCINIFSCIYIFINSFVKDYNNLTNIYLRYNYKIYYFIKSIVIILIISLLKIVQYLLLFCIIRFVFNRDMSGIIHLIINDLSFSLLIGFLVLLLYIIFKVFKKSRIIVSVITVILFFIFIINTINISKINNILFIIGIIIIIIITNLVIVRKNKKVIQEIGGI